MKIIPWDGLPITKPGLYSGVPIDVYHGGHLCDGPAITSSAARKIFSESLLDYWVYSPYNPKRLDPPPPPAHFILGRATHHLGLGEADFSKYFVVRPDEVKGEKWHGNRTVCKQWLESQQMLGLQVLSSADMDAIKGMLGYLPWQEGLEDCGLANNNFIKEGLLNGHIEISIVAKDPATGVWLLARPDSIPVDSSVAGDIKTTESVTDHAIRHTIGDYRYDMQAAMIRLCLRLTANLELQSFALAFVQKKIPHSVVVKQLLTAQMDIGEADLRAAINAFAKALKTGKWLGPGDGKRDAETVNLPEWALNSAKRRREELGDLG